MMGDKDAARKSYQDFLTLWEDADPDIPIYRQAKAMRDESGLSLRDRSGTDTDNVAVPIHVNVALPKNVAAVQFPNDQWLAFLLAPWRPVLEQLRDSTQDTQDHVFKALSQDKRATELLAQAREPISAAHGFSERVLQTVNQLDLVRWLYDVDHHILGSYCWAPDSPRPGEIYLYWGAIGLIARQLSIRTEELTVVVLGHELGHAYSHIGADIEGHRWSSPLFSDTESDLKEALAQHFTLQICRRLTTLCPEAEKAFSNLLPHQPDLYQKHRQWGDYRAEEIRQVLIRTRRNRYPGTMAEFSRLLDQAKHELRGRGTAVVQSGLLSEPK